MYFQCKSQEKKFFFFQKPMLSSKLFTSFLCWHCLTLVNNLLFVFSFLIFSQKIIECLSILYNVKDIVSIFYESFNQNSLKLLQLVFSVSFLLNGGYSFLLQNFLFTFFFCSLLCFVAPQCLAMNFAIFNFLFFTQSLLVGVFFCVLFSIIRKYGNAYFLSVLMQIPTKG